MKNKKKRPLTLSDEVHYIIYKQLDEIHTANAYEVASYIFGEIKKRVGFRRRKK